MIKGKYAKRRGGFLLGRIFFDKKKIRLKYLFSKEIFYSENDIDNIKYTYASFSPRYVVKYFQVTFYDENRIYIFEKRNVNSEDKCRTYIQSKFKGKFVNTGFERFLMKLNLMI